MVVDTSILLSIFFNEEHASWSRDQLKSNYERLIMSSVNLAETLIVARYRQPHLIKEIEDRIHNSGIGFQDATVVDSFTAYEARSKFPINLGDCFAYSLAKRFKCPILTLDDDFLKTDASIFHPSRTAP